ncbi:MAG: hypothetical protein Metus_0863 [Candidatus Methanosuratincola subterraneus]|uniref:Uncharacterized protein n=1 Tax=Methanosuratincola subterraneus TaxID=2593994 RepID=A0A444L5P5_METS7|nr:MAG: hypothetical protein Metus_0863 [Candidatus Methanosuratincola subterraneus]
MKSSSKSFSLSKQKQEESKLKNAAPRKADLQDATVKKKR